MYATIYKASWDVQDFQTDLGSRLSACCINMRTQVPIPTWHPRENLGILEHETLAPMLWWAEAGGPMLFAHRHPKLQ